MGPAEDFQAWEAVTNAPLQADGAEPEDHCAGVALRRGPSAEGAGKATWPGSQCLATLELAHQHGPTGSFHPISR